jgi:S1-C subfamily serine protease
MGFAIPGSLAQAIVSDIEEFGYSKQIPGVGIQFSDISQNRDYLIGQGIAIPEGITVGFYIIEVTPGSSVDGYVVPGDIILEIGDIVITSSYYFSAEFSKYHVGDLIDIVVYRDGATLTLTDIELKPKVS